jgi:hypothetical protein
MATPPGDGQPAGGEYRAAGSGTAAGGSTGGVLSSGVRGDGRGARPDASRRPDAPVLRAPAVDALGGAHVRMACTLWYGNVSNKDGGEWQHLVANGIGSRGVPGPAGVTSRCTGVPRVDQRPGQGFVTVVAEVHGNSTAWKERYTGGGREVMRFGFRAPSVGACGSHTCDTGRPAVGCGRYSACRSAS